MNSYFNSKLRPLMVLAALLGALAGSVGDSLAQRLPESGRGASVACQAPLLLARRATTPAGRPAPDVIARKPNPMPKPPMHQLR